MTPDSIAMDYEELKRILRNFEVVTGINVAEWANRQIPTTEYDDLDPRVCVRCGIRQNGPHRNWIECLIAYRELCFRLQAENEGLKRNRDRGLRRSDDYFVILHGERMCLSDAARQLNLTFDALRRRIMRRGGRIEDEIDLDALEIDKRYARKKSQAAEVGK